MHETKFANEILFVLNSKLDKNKPTRSILVNVRLSPFSHVTAEGLKETFRHLLEGEDYSDVRLDIKPLELEYYCNGCGYISKTPDRVTDCPRCNSSNINVQTGKEFIIESIEVET